MPNDVNQSRVQPVPASALDAGRARLRVLLEGPLDLPPLSPASAAIANMAADSNGNAVQLAQLVQQDPAVAANVMRVANSAAFAPRAPIVSLSQAIGWLGMAEIQAIAFSVAVRGKLFTGRSDAEVFSSLWRTSVATACWCREVARLKKGGVELAYLCGLLHRIGRPLIVRALASLPPAEAARLMAPERTRLIEEFELDAGRALARAWSLPEAVVSCIAAWRDESGEAERTESAAPWISQIWQVRLGQALAARMLDDAGPLAFGQDLGPCCETLGIYPEEADRLLQREQTIRNALDALA